MSRVLNGAQGRLRLQGSGSGVGAVGHVTTALGREEMLGLTWRIFGYCLTFSSGVINFGRNYWKVSFGCLLRQPAGLTLGLYPV